MPYINKINKPSVILNYNAVMYFKFNPCPISFCCMRRYGMPPMWCFHNERSLFHWLKRKYNMPTTVVKEIYDKFKKDVIICLYKFYNNLINNKNKLEELDNKFLDIQNYKTFIPIIYHLKTNAPHKKTREYATKSYYKILKLLTKYP